MLITFATYTVIMKKELNGAFEDLHQKNCSDSNLITSLNRLLQHGRFQHSPGATPSNFMAIDHDD